MSGLVRKIVGSRNDRAIRKYTRVAHKINALEPSLEKLSDAKLQAKTAEFKQRIEKGAKVDDLLIEAFAVVREASKRTIGLRHFDVQLVGGMVLNNGDIAEMRTGEGKTLVATLPMYLNALSGKGAHLVTVNDYLARRDAELMRPVYEFLGMTVGIIVSDMEPDTRKEAYACDITYGTNNEFGFDYLRDNMIFDTAEQVQRGHNFSVVDEVDSILIDEARTPLIISGASEESSELYIKLNQVLPKLKKRETEEGKGDYYLDEKAKQAFLTEDGHVTLEKILVKEGMLEKNESLYSPKNVTMMHYINAVLRGLHLYHRDVDYLVQNNEVMIVDEHTGRAMPGRRWSDGLHQAVEAKEGVAIQGENQTLASITFQNFFRLYDKLSGMTGTADTEAYEFHQIYGLDVAVVPTHKPMVRQDHADFIFLTIPEKFEAIVKDIQECHAKGQPVLVGTASIESSELIARELKKAKIDHEILNAKQHEREAKIVANAGMPGAVTIATNMAGRGTDIILGGSPKMEVEELEKPTEAKIKKINEAWQKRHDDVIAAGGLHILGTERHESRRIDNQLRGRSGRQGDKGSSRFFLSMDDNLVRIFAGDRIRGMMEKLGMGKGEAIESRMVSKSVASAQKKVEQYNFDIRKQLLEYDNVANDQRSVIYSQRAELLAAESISDVIDHMLEETTIQAVHNYIPPQSLEEQWDVPGLEENIYADFNVKLPVQKWLDKDTNMDDEALVEKVQKELSKVYNDKRKDLEKDVVNSLEKTVLLQTLDTHWREHLSAMDHLRQSIHLRGYAQKDPKQEFKRESFELFSDMLDAFKYEVVSTLVKVEIGQPEDVQDAQNHWRGSMGSMNFTHANLDMNAPDQIPIPNQDITIEGEDGKQIPIQAGDKVGRNDPCPCGSGNKFKHCHGKLG